ncbi:hypothetical protein CH254_15620 [Rhodococcus sp. 06-412-2C]|uniref:hypothetical protein n=1 Tax=unclassified Rhodococcus (in: high G+C Gram-positive bacteria) TaxID=192944 RepID=UPI000B9B20A7|nr:MULTISPECIES: hypothetical protein [unclassified Rhodococcus (in: high G+C Gram-positive bacteria)]OZC87118.1 hypothetical protein CH254_15620 [Rhodococcus sp. 06-412-2C]OZD00559.1 hypothetical protein CH279_05985 [Rhodococcus sp. 06-412-2B]
MTEIEDVRMVAQFVSRSHPAVITRLHNHIQLLVTSRGRSDDRLGPHERLQGPASRDETIRVVVACSFHPYTDDLGTFPPETGPVFVRVRVVGRRLPPTEPPLRTIGPPDAAIPVTEAEGWVRAALGEWWADYAYEYSDHREPTAPAAWFRFGVILDRTAAPMLAPDNFDWSRIDGPAENGVRKLASSAGNAFLQQHLSEVGPYAATARYLDPRTTPDGRWRVRVDSHSAYPGTLDTFTALANRLRIRGVVDTRFVPISLDLEGGTATLVYQLTGSPALYDAHVPIPTEPELRVLPTDQTWGARYGYHPPVFPLTADQWASGLCAFWSEMVAYGRIGDVRAPWAGRG